MVEICMLEVKPYIMYELYYTRDMSYVSLINSLLAKTSFIFGLTLGCIIYPRINISLMFEPAEKQYFLLLLGLIMHHKAVEIINASAKAM